MTNIDMKNMMDDNFKKKLEFLTDNLKKKKKSVRAGPRKRTFGAGMDIASYNPVNIGWTDFGDYLYFVVNSAKFGLFRPIWANLEHFGPIMVKFWHFATAIFIGLGHDVWKKDPSHIESHCWYLHLFEWEVNPDF